MRALVQRVTRAAVRIDGAVVGAIGPGLLVFLGIRRGDTQAEADWLARKLPALRIFPGERGTFDRALQDTGGALLVVSQFTLYGESRRGLRPDFGASAAPMLAEPLYRHFVERLRADGFEVATGVFGAMMAVALENDGPVTLLLEREASNEGLPGPASEPAS
jgi:D-tyrosyl-tRNA(Tyr) deacylase